MATLFLHVGHSKTGTSWLQAALRENQAGLVEAGLAYPIFHGIGAESGAEIGQGNGLALALAADYEQLRSGLALIHRSAGPRGVVLSSEEFFPRFSEYDDPAILPRAARASGFERVEILLFIRDPVGHAASLWQQYLKRGGGTVSIERFFERYRVPERVGRFLESFDSIAGIGITCLNYDRHRRDLLAPLRCWLGLSGSSLNRPRVLVINRGMTWAELNLQVAVNRRLGRAGILLSDALCAGLPDQTPDVVRPGLASQKAMCERLTPVLERVNQFLPENEHYRWDTGSAPGPESGSGLVFSPEQIDLIGRALGGEIRRLRAELDKLRQVE